MTAHNFKDLTGQKFGKLTVIKRAKNDKYGRSMWLCECECGGKNTVSGYHLTTGMTQSCGCLNYRKIKSNTMFRKIKRMSVDEMAEWLVDEIGLSCSQCKYYKASDGCTNGFSGCETAVTEHYKQYLLQEVEE